MKLFVYGLLKPGHMPPKSARSPVKDRIHGDLFRLDEYPAAVAVGVSVNWIEGVVIDIDPRELPELDEFEDVGIGLYRRVAVTTETGVKAETYEYMQPIPQSAVRIERWP